MCRDATPHCEAGQAVEEYCRAAGQALSLEIFKIWLDKGLWPALSLDQTLLGAEVALETFQGPFQPELSSEPGLGPRYAEGCHTVRNTLSQGCAGR